MGGSVGKYFDDYEREADYQNWLYYRESSHEERESKSHYISQDEAEVESRPKLVVTKIEWPAVDVFRDFPEHQALITAAEKKYFESKSCVRDTGDDQDGD